MSNQLVDESEMDNILQNADDLRGENNSAIVKANSQSKEEDQIIKEAEELLKREKTTPNDINDGSS